MNFIIKSGTRFQLTDRNVCWSSEGLCGYRAEWTESQGDFEKWECYSESEVSNRTGKTRLYGEMKEKPVIMSASSTDRLPGITYYYSIKGVNWLKVGFVVICYD